MGRYGQRWWLGHDNRSSHQWWTNHTNWSRSFMVRKWWNTSITWTMENAPNRRYISRNLIFYLWNFLKILLSRKSCWCFLFCGTTSTNQWRRNSNCHCCWSFLCSKTWIGLDRRSKRKSKLNNHAIKWIQDNWKNTDLQKSVLIDTAGWYFDVHFHDMTMNGKALVKID